jgi:hypothetical protein
LHGDFKFLDDAYFPPALRGTSLNAALESYELAFPFLVKYKFLAMYQPNALSDIPDRQRFEQIEAG